MTVIVSVSSTGDDAEIFCWECLAVLSSVFGQFCKVASQMPARIYWLMFVHTEINTHTTSQSVVKAGWINCNDIYLNNCTTTGSCFVEYSIPVPLLVNSMLG